MIRYIQIGIGAKCINILLGANIRSPCSVISLNKLVYSKVTDYILESACS